MNPIFTETKKRLHEKALSNGFILKRNSYYKLMDGFVQGFKIYTNNQSYSIRFFQLPLCSNIDTRFEGDDVSIFWTDISGPFSTGEIYAPEMVEWIRNPFNIQLTPGNYVNEASEILVRCYDEYVLPWFKKSASLEKAYEAYVQLHKKISDSLSGRLFEWMLQMEKYEKALEYLKKKIEELQAYSKLNGCEIEIDEDLMECKVNIEQKKYEYVQNYVYNREQQTIKTLGLKR